MTLSAIVRQLRQLVLEHPECAEHEVFIALPGEDTFVPVTSINTVLHTVEITYRLEDLVNGE